MEAPPSSFVISTGAQRSGEVWGRGVLSWERFSAGEVMGLRPAQGDEKYLLFGNHTQWKRRPPLLSSRPERSVVKRSAVQRTFSWECFSTGEVMDLRPAQGDEKYLLFGNHTQWKRRPPLLSSRPERSVVERSAVQRTFPGNVFRPEKSRAFGPPKGVKNVFPATTLNGSAALPFCHLDRSAA